MSRKKKTPGEQDVQPDLPQADAAEQALDPTASEMEAVNDEGATEPALDAQEAQAEPKCDEAAEKLAAAQAKADEYLALAQRVQADFENFRRRNKDVRHDAFEDGARAFATTLLPVLDNMERALSASAESPDKSLRDGVEMVNRQLTDAFTKRGITPIDRKGEKFDPNMENAVMQGTAEDGEPGTVCEVLQKGYQLDGVVLRHAMVKVVPD